jgi:pimeloyl-ACP methyl ester carboxylesterase
MVQQLLSSSRWGSEEGQPLVLVHGFSCSSRWWRATGELLADRHPLLSVDLPGHGDSPRWRQGYEMPVQGQAIAELLRQEDLSGVVLIAHSMGGHAALETAVLAADRVAGIVLVNTPPTLPHEDLGLLARLGFLPGLGPLMRATATDSLRRRAIASLFAPGFEVPGDLVGDSGRMARDSYPGAYRAMIRYVSSQTGVSERLAELELPKLVIWGEADSIWPLRSGCAMAAYGKAEFVVVPGVGHSPQVEAPEAVAPILAEFVSSGVGGRA